MADVDMKVKKDVPISPGEQEGVLIEEQDVKKTLTFGTTLGRFLFTGVGGSEPTGKSGDCGGGTGVTGGHRWGMSPRPRREAAEVGEAKRRCFGVGRVDGARVMVGGEIKLEYVDSLQKASSTRIDNLSASSGRGHKKPTSAKVTKRNTKSTPSPLRTRTPISTKIPKSHLTSLLTHPSPLLDILSPSLLLILIGTNPGLLTAYTGHNYSSPTNSFWKLLHASKLTPTENNLPLQATEDRALPKRFLLGNTNIVERASRNQEDLGREEMVLGAGRTVGRIRRWRPEAVCIVGKGVWEAFVGWGRRMKLGSGFSGTPVAGKRFRWGWQVDSEGGELRMGVGNEVEGEEEGEGEEEEKGGVPGRCWLAESKWIEPPPPPPPPKYDAPWEGAKIYVVPSTSGLVTIPFAKKLELWEGVAEWVAKRRVERGFICT